MSVRFPSYTTRLYTWASLDWMHPFCTCRSPATSWYLGTYCPLVVPAVMSTEVAHLRVQSIPDKRPALFLTPDKDVRGTTRGRIKRGSWCGNMESRATPMRTRASTRASTSSRGGDNSASSSFFFFCFFFSFPTYMCSRKRRRRARMKKKTDRGPKSWNMLTTCVNLGWIPCAATFSGLTLYKKALV